MTNHNAGVVKENVPIKSMKSEKSTKVCYVRFFNRSERVVEVIWMNFEGKEKCYQTLTPCQSYDVTTFETHPWIFRDHFTHQSLYVNSLDVYYPQQRFIALVPPRLVQGELVTTQPARILAQITIAVYPLKELCLCVVLRHLRSKDDVAGLHIPRTLKEDLDELWRSTCTDCT